MEKKIFHDIIPNDKRSIRNIPILRKNGEIEDNLNDPATSQDALANRAPITARSAADEDRVVHVAIEPDESEESSHNSHGHAHEKRALRAAPKRRKRISDGIRADIEASVTPAVVGAKSHAHKTAVAGLDDHGDRLDTENDEDQDEDAADNSEESFEAWQKKHKGPSRKTWGIISAVAVIALFFLSMHFASATITISPTKHELALQSTNIPLGDIPMETVTADSIDASQTIEANGTVKVDRKATGRVIMYNAYNSSSQKLVANTRLETPNGLIYYTAKEISIPGQKTVNGKATPGSAEVDVTAEKTGDSYNQGLRDFKIVAYKGSGRYDKIYGRSKTSLASGYSGTVPNISQNAIASTTDALKQQIAAQIDEQFTKEARSKKGYVYLPGTKTIQYGDVSQKVSSDGTKATISLSAKATGSIFEQASLSKVIVQIENASITGSSTSSANLNGSTTASSSASSSASTTAMTDGVLNDEIVYTGDLSGLTVKSNASSLTISGSTSITSAIDNEKIARAVSNLSKEQAVAALKKLVELDSVDISIWPWWKGTLPGADRIKIVTEN